MRAVDLVSLRLPMKTFHTKSTARLRVRVRKLVCEQGGAEILGEFRYKLIDSARFLGPEERRKLFPAAIGTKILARNPFGAQCLGLVGFRGGSYDFGLFSVRLNGSRNR